MSWSIDLGRPFGIRVRAHWLFLLLLGWAFLFWGGIEAVAVCCLVFGFVVLHELGHALVGRRFGVRVKDITLLPIGGMARLDGPPPTPRGEFWMALAGPAVNVALALALGLLAAPLGVWTAALRSPVLAWAVSGLALLIGINVVLAVFNLLPAFPMDGGRVYRAWLAKRWGMVEATRRAARVGRWVAAGMAIVGLLTFHLVLVLIALFVWLAGKQEEFAVRLRHAAAPTITVNPLHGWQASDGASCGAGGDGARGPAGGTVRVFYTPDPREIEAALRRLKERMRRHP
jgi:stage IV sporulation protein FB